MGFAELLLIAVGLSMDAFAVSICKGLSVEKVSPRHAALAGAYFGGFQFLMPVLGYLLAIVAGTLVAGLAYAVLKRPEAQTAEVEKAA